MFSDFDPLAELEKLKQQNQHTQATIQQLITAVREIQTLQGRIIDQLNQQTGAINALDENQQDHDGRLRLIEITRQYENQTTTPRS